MSIAASAYRRLLRARNVAFGGDMLALNKSRDAIKQGILANCTETHPDKIASLLKDVDEAEEMLRYHILQGRKNERGNYAVDISAEKATKISTHEKFTHIDESNLPAAPQPIVTKHKGKQK